MSKLKTYVKELRRAYPIETLRQWFVSRSKDEIFHKVGVFAQSYLAKPEYGHQAIWVGFEILMDNRYCPDRYRV